MLTQVHVAHAALRELAHHVGIGEQRVPFMVSEPLTPAYLAGKPQGLRNFDIFDAAKGLVRALAGAVVPSLNRKF